MTQENFPPNHQRILELIHMGSSKCRLFYTIHFTWEAPNVVYFRRYISHGKLQMSFILYDTFHVGSSKCRLFYTIHFTWEAPNVVYFRRYISRMKLQMSFILYDTFHVGSSKCRLF